MREIVNQKIITALQPILQKQNLSVKGIDESRSLLAQGILDSISFLEFTMTLERIFEIEFDFGDLAPTEFTSLDQLTTLAVEQLSAQKE